MTSINEQRECVRELARQYLHAVQQSDQTAIQQRWADVNELRRPDRAPVWCRPVGCWSELLPEADFICDDPWLLQMERVFRKALVKLDIGDDEPLETTFIVPPVIDIDPPNRWGVEIGRHQATEAGGAWAYDPPIKTPADLDKLRMPEFHYNQEASLANLARHEELLGDILPCRLALRPPYDSATIIGQATAELRGLEQMMLDMIDEPELLHRILAHVRDARLAELDCWEATGLIEPNIHEPMLLSDSIGEPVDGRYTLKNCWCSGNSQEFDQVSPGMWEEFCLAYQRPIFERFGRINYGCCENLTHKLDGVLTIPNLRIVVCSAWTDFDTLLEKVGTDYCIMWRQKASDVVFPDSVATIRDDLETGLKKLQGRYYQVVLRELQTLSGHPRRLHDWAALGKQLAAEYA